MCSEVIPLQVTVSRNFKTAGAEGFGDKARAINAKRGISAPEVRHTEKQLGRGNGIGQRAVQ